MHTRTDHLRTATGLKQHRCSSCNPSSTPTKILGGFSRQVRSALYMLVAAVALSACNAQAGDFVIVVDVSGSMSDAISSQDKRVRVTVVQEALRQYLPALPSGSRIDLIAFNSGIVAEQEVILKDASALANALVWVDGLAKEASKKGQTHLWTTLRHALKTASRYSQENPEQPVTVRVLTDGGDNENVTTLDKVLQEFLPVLDGEKIRSNLVLLGDMEFTTKLSLPEGAFEMTKNPSWEVLFPPIVLFAPAEPKIGEDVRLFENNTRSIYKDYEWLVDGKSAGKEKVLSMRFKDPRNYRVTLKVTGLQGTKNSATVIVKIKDEGITACIKGPAEIVSGRVVQFAGEIAGPCESVEWNFGDGTISPDRNPQHSFECKEAEFQDFAVNLRAVSPLGKAVESLPHTIRVWAEKTVPAPQAAFRILTPNPKVGEPIQTIEETTGPVETVQWDVNGEPQVSTRNPELRINTPGDKTIRMTVRGPGGESIATKKITVRPRYAQPIVSCQASTLKGTTPLTVQFKNCITGDYRSLLWTFGDGQSTTNSNPLHTFARGTNYVVSLTAFPMDRTQPDATRTVIIKAVKPWPTWAKATAAILPCLLLLGIAAGLLRQRRIKALRLPVYYWAEQSLTCQTVMLTRADEEFDLSPVVPLRIKRDGRSRNLIARPLEGAVLFASSGQEATMLSIGDGLRVTIRDASGLDHAVAISIRQKPCRPTPASDGLETLPEDDVCGLLKPSGEVPPQTASDEFDWGLGNASPKAG